MGSIMASAYHEPKNLKPLDPRRRYAPEVEVPMGPLRIPKRRNDDG